MARRKAPSKAPSKAPTQNQIKRFIQKRKHEINKTGTSYPKAKDPRGPIDKEPVHSYLDVDEMHHVIRRATPIQELLRDDVFGLAAYDAPHRVCPLKFHLVRSAVELKKTELDACFGLVEMTSGRDYEASSIGWHPALKRQEMLDSTMIYLLIRQGDVGVAAPEPTQGESQAEASPELTQGEPHAEASPELTQGETHAEASPEPIKGESQAEASPEPIKSESQAEASRSEQTLAQLNPLEQIIYGYTSDSEEDVDQTMNEPQVNASEEVEEETIDKPKDIVDTAPTPSAEAVKRELPVDFEPTGRPHKKYKWPDPSNNGRILGFLSFMFTNDDPPHDNRDVVYIYEIHLHRHLRGQGLGSNLIRFVEHAALHCGISKTMLTVFTANKGARAMYEKLGYVKDKCSPKDRVTRAKVIEADYMIMSKELIRRME